MKIENVIETLTAPNAFGLFKDAISAWTDQDCSFESRQEFEDRNNKWRQDNGLPHPDELHYAHYNNLMESRRRLYSRCKKAKTLEGLKVMSALAGWINSEPSVLAEGLSWIEERDFGYIVKDICRYISSGDTWMYNAVKAVLNFVSTLGHVPPRLCAPRREPIVNTLRGYNTCIRWYSGLPKWFRKVSPRRLGAIMIYSVPIEEARKVARGGSYHTRTKREEDRYYSLLGNAPLGRSTPALEKVLKKMLDHNIAHDITTVRWHLGILESILFTDSTYCEASDNMIPIHYKMIGLNRKDLLKLSALSRREGRSVSISSYSAAKEIYNFIQDGARIYQVNIGEELTPVTTNMSLAEAVRRSGKNHRFLHSDRMKREAGKYMDLEKMPRLYDLPDHLEKLRIKTAGEMRLAGAECHHCLGSYVSSKNSMYFRNGSVCAQVTGYDVVQCYDDRDTKTSKSKKFQKWLTEELSKLYEKRTRPVDTSSSYASVSGDYRQVAGGTATGC